MPTRVPREPHQPRAWLSPLRAQRGPLRAAHAARSAPRRARLSSPQLASLWRARPLLPALRSLAGVGLCSVGRVMVSLAGTLRAAFFAADVALTGMPASI